MFCLESAASSLRIIASIEKSVGFLIALAGCCSWLAVPMIILYNASFSDSSARSRAKRVDLPPYRPRNSASGRRRRRRRTIRNPARGNGTAAAVVPRKRVRRTTRFSSRQTRVGSADDDAIIAISSKIYYRRVGKLR